MQRHYEAWRNARLDFNARLVAREPEAERQGWQKWYVRGTGNPSGAEPSPDHMSKVNLADPVHRDRRRLDNAGNED